MFTQTSADVIRATVGRLTSLLCESVIHQVKVYLIIRFCRCKYLMVSAVSLQLSCVNKVKKVKNKS